MLRAHKQAWCWQDEWHGLTMDDIRRLEKETQLALRQKFGAVSEEEFSDSQSTSSVPQQFETVSFLFKNVIESCFV